MESSKFVPSYRTLAWLVPTAVLALGIAIWCGRKYLVSKYSSNSVAQKMQDIFDRKESPNRGKVDNSNDLNNNKFEPIDPQRVSKDRSSPSSAFSLDFSALDGIDYVQLPLYDRGITYRIGNLKEIPKGIKNASAAYFIQPDWDAFVGSENKLEVFLNVKGHVISTKWQNGPSSPPSSEHKKLLQEVEKAIQYQTMKNMYTIEESN